MFVAIVITTIRVITFDLKMRKDKKEAVRLARLKMKASARGAAPPPPPPGSKKAPPPVAVPGAGDGEPGQ